VSMMFIISWYTTLIVFFLAALLFVYIQSKHAEREWGDSISGLKFLVIKTLLNNLRYTALTHAKNWRPQLCVMFSVTEDGEPTDKGLLRLAGQLKKGRGLAMFVGVSEGDTTLEESYTDDARLRLREFLTTEGITAYSRIIVSDNFHQSFTTGLQTLGIAAMRPNSVMVSWEDNWQDDNVNTMRYVRKLKTALAKKVATIVYKVSPEYEAPVVPYESGFIDIWWVIHDGGLLLLLPYLLTLHKQWRNCSLRLFAVSMTNESPEDVEKLTYDFLNAVRIDATVTIITLNVDTSDDINAKMTEMRKARMNFEAELSENQEFLAPSSPAKSKNPEEKALLKAGKSDEEESPTDDLQAKENETKAHVRIRQRSVEYTFAIDETQMRFAVALNQQIVEKSSSANLVVTNLPIMPSSRPTDLMSFVDAITKDIPAVMLIRGSGDEVVTKYG